MDQQRHYGGLNSPCAVLLQGHVGGGEFSSVIPVKEKAQALGKGIIAFSPLAQGLLSDRYLNGITPDSRVMHDGRFLHESDVQKYHGAIVKLNAIAKERGQSLAQMALAWILKDGAVASVLIGASKVSQIKDNLGALKDTHFSSDELAAIDAACHGLI